MSNPPTTHPLIERIRQRITISTEKKRSGINEYYTTRVYVDDDLIDRCVSYSDDELDVTLHYAWNLAVNNILHHTHTPLVKKLHLEEVRIILNMPLDRDRCVLYDGDIQDDDICRTIH